MTCKLIMVDPPVCLRPTDTVAAALAQMNATQSSALPVTDESGRFVGVFGAKQALALVLPRAARLGSDLGDLAYVKDSLDDVRKRYAAFADKPVRSAMAEHDRVSPDTAMIEALLLLERGDCFLPVVDSAGKLVGIITADKALQVVAEGC